MHFAGIFMKMNTFLEIIALHNDVGMWCGSISSVLTYTLRRKVMVVVCHLAAVIQRRCVIKDMGYNFVLFNSSTTLYTTMEGSFLPPGGWTLEPERE